MKPGAQKSVYRIAGILKFKGVEFLSSLNSIAKDTAKKVEANAEKSKDIRENLSRVGDIQLKIDKSKSAQEEIIERQEKFLKNTSTSTKATSNAFENIFKAVLKKPIEILQKLLLGAIIALAPKIISAIKKIINQFKLVKFQFEKFIETGSNWFSNSIGVVEAIITNALNFDFTDKSQRLENALKEYEKDFKQDRQDLEEISKMWGLNEDELSRAVSLMEQGKDPRTARQRAIQPTETITGRPATSTGSNGTTGASTFDLIASAEGDYNSVNRGTAGDTPGGAQSIFGRELTDMTVGEIVRAQDRGDVFAVGRYQIIPSTMKEFLNNSDVSLSDKFDATTQDKFKDYVINVKRPEVGAYLSGESDDRDAAAQGLAREFAGVGLTMPEAGRSRGESRYAGTGGNAATISPEEIGTALDRDRAANLSGGRGTTSTASNGGTVSPSGNTTNTDALKTGDQVSGYEVSSAYGPRWGTTHRGVDIATPVGTYVAFTVPVEVVATGTYGAYGYLVDVWAPSLGIQFRLAHLSRILVGSGQMVPAGVPVARTGGAKGHPGSGRSTGPHLHFEVDNVRNSTRGGGTNDPRMLAKYAKYIILDSRPPTTQMVGKIGGINNINSSTRIDEKMTALGYDYEAAEKSMNTQIVMVTQPIVATKTTVVNRTKMIKSAPVAMSNTMNTRKGFNQKLMNSLA